MEEVTGKNVRIRFDGARCIHARKCVLTHPDVFVPNVDGAWIRPDATDPDEVMRVAVRCPSGAIQVERLDGGAPEAAPVRNTVAVWENGPLEVRGDLRLNEQPAGFRATLCRCGNSKNKPFCDNSHRAAGFVATGEPAQNGEVTAWPEGAHLVLEPLKDGPLKVSGPVEITGASGRTVQRTDKAFLCRCGQSANKPYCDGTHRKVGFSAD